MKHILRLSFCMIMLLLLGAMSACGPVDSQTTGGDTTEETPKEMGDLVLVANKASDFVVMRSDVAEQEEIDAAVAFRKLINSAGDFQIPITTDWVKRGEEVPTDTKELLIGSTNRAETADAMSRIKEGQYIIKVYENRIVLYSDTPKGLNEAIEVFKAQFLDNCGGTVTIPADYEWIADTPVFIFDPLNIPKEPEPGPEPAYTRVTYYVATDGSDERDGKTPETAFATLEKARDAVRALGDNHAAVIYLRGGTYPITKTFSLNAKDSGTSLVPTIYTSYPGERAVLSGGLTLDRAGFSTVSDDSVLSRLSEEVRDKVLVYTLPASALANLGTYGESLTAAELYLDDEPLQISRWPNEGFAIIDRALDPNTMVFSVKEKLPEWLSVKHMRVNGYWGNDWYMNDLGITSVDYNANTITTDKKSSYTLKAGQRFYAFNILEELDAPGEWYIDRESGKLYLYPPEGYENKTLTLSLLGSTMLSMQGAKHVKICNVDFAYGRGDAIVIDGDNGRGNLIYNCTIRNMGGKAATVRGKQCGVAECHIFNIGRGGISLGSGNATNLWGAENFVVNCDIHNYSRVIRTYTPAVDISGVGNYVLFNEIYDAPHFAIRFTGQLHQMRYNYIHNVVQETADASAVYAGRSLVWRGNDISYNYFKDILSPTLRVSTAAIYLDDYMSGVVMEGNIFENIGKEALKLANGRDNIFRNNIIIKASTSIGYRVRGYKVGEKNYNSLMSRFDSVPYQSDLWRYYFPDLEHMIVNEKTMEHLQAVNNLVENNVRIGSGGMSESNKYATFRNNPSLAANTDIGFVNMKEGNYALKSDASIYNTLKDFVAPPFELMGKLNGKMEEILTGATVCVIGSDRVLDGGKLTVLASPADAGYAESVRAGRNVYTFDNGLVIITAGENPIDIEHQYGQNVADALVRHCLFHN